MDVGKVKVTRDGAQLLSDTGEVVNDSGCASRRSTETINDGGCAL